MRTRKPLADTSKALDTLAKEVTQCILSRLNKAGFQTQPDCCWWNETTGRWMLSANGVSVGLLLISKTKIRRGLELRALAGGGPFVHVFGLNSTDSPRKVSCILIGWLKQAQVRQVMTM
jgi:hypothetical protein